jgi:hypothetical protein
MSDSNDDFIRQIKEQRDARAAINNHPQLVQLRGASIRKLRECEAAELVTRVAEFNIPGGTGCLCVVDDNPLFVIHYESACNESGAARISVWKASRDGKPVGEAVYMKPHPIQSTQSEQDEMQASLLANIQDWVASKTVTKLR